MHYDGRCKYWHINPNAIWFWRSTKDLDYTAQVCRVNDAYQLTVFRWRGEIKKGSQSTLTKAMKLVFRILRENT